MERQALTETLSLAAAALSSKDIIAVLSCFCFDGETVTAYDDVVAIQAPLAMPIKCGVRGQTLLGFLTASRAAEIEMTKEADHILVKAGRAKLKLPWTSSKDFIFTVPEADPTDAKFDLDAEFIEALTAASTTMGLDTSHPWRLGVSVSFAEDSITLYSNNNMHVSTCFSYKAQVPRKAQGKYATLHPQFVTLLLSMHKKFPAEQLTLGKTYAQVRFAGGATLFARLIDKTDAPAHIRIAKACDAKFAEMKGQPLPKGFSRSLDRAMVVLNGMNDRVAEFTVTDGRLRVTARSVYGEVNDPMAFEEHADTACQSFPEIILKAVEGCDKIAISDQGIVLKGPNITRLVRAIALRAEETATESDDTPPAKAKR